MSSTDINKFKTIDLLMAHPDIETVGLTLIFSNTPASRRRRVDVDQLVGKSLSADVSI